MTEKLPTPKFRPLRDRVLVLRDDAESETEGGIIVPEGAKKPPSRGIVIAVGKGLHTEQGVLIPVDLDPGDHITFGAHSGQDIEIDGQEYVVITSSDVLGVI